MRRWAAGSPCQASSAASSRPMASITARPASSCSSADHRPQPCSNARVAASQAVTGRAAVIGARRVSTASIRVSRGSACTACGQPRTPSWRRRCSSARSASASNTGASLSQSSTASLLARGAQARSAAIRLAAACVVDSFQPVSSRNSNPGRSPRAASSALMRRVSARSPATRATGTRPAITWRSTQATARSASSSPSAQRCSATWPRAAGAGSGSTVAFSM